MLLGYYYADGRYGDHFREQAPYTNLYRVSRSSWYGDPRGETEAAVASIERAAKAGKSLQLALDIGSQNVGGQGWKLYLRAVLRELERLEALDQVVAIEVRDEPPWSGVDAVAKAEAVRTMLDGKLEQVPLGVTLAGNDILGGVGRFYGESAGYGYVAAEAYLPLSMEWEPEAADAEAYRLVKRLRRHCAGIPEFWVVGQSYDRNGAFGPTAALKAAQHGTYRAAKEVGAEAIVWFSYGRMGGVESYPGLRKEHRAIARAEGILA